MNDTKLNYSISTESSPSEQGSYRSVNNAKTALSKQAVVNNAILSKMPQGGGGAPAPQPAQTTGFGRTR